MQAASPAQDRATESLRLYRAHRWKVQMASKHSLGGLEGV
jgi:hypothetical protein